MKDVKNIFSDVKFVPSDNHEDQRGFFSEIYNEFDFKKINIEDNFLQDNLSYSDKKNTLRGMHFQLKPYSQSKLIKVIKGSIFDVFIDLRLESEYFEKFGYYNLNENDGWIYIPKGFAHGFLTTSDHTIVMYKVDSYYNNKKESGIIWNDQFFNIPWPTTDSELIISEKDSSLPSWSSIKEQNIEDI